MKLEGSKEWAKRAMCKDMNVHDFYPGRGQATIPIKIICRSCPVVKPCLEYAMRNNEKFGIWGATSERERRKMRSAKARHQRNGVSTTMMQLIRQFGFNITTLREASLEPFSGEDGYE